MNNSPAEDFGNVPNASATFGTIPNDAEPFRTVRNVSERTENHTLTVREVARLFEQAGLPRTERSIINWCRLNRQGVARLEAFFDENEGRYYITQQSVNRAVEEERATQPAAGNPPTTEKELPHHAETPPRRDAESSDRVKELERQNRDLEIATRAKDYYLERLEKERGQYVEQPRRHEPLHRRVGNPIASTWGCASGRPHASARCGRLRRNVSPRGSSDGDGGGVVATTQFFRQTAGALSGVPAFFLAL